MTTSRPDLDQHAQDDAPPTLPLTHGLVLVAIVVDASAAMVLWAAGHTLAAGLLVLVTALVFAAAWLAELNVQRHYRRAMTQRIDYFRATEQACELTADNKPTTPLPADELARRRGSNTTGSHR